MEQQKIMQAQLIEQEINQITSQIQLIDQNIKELEEIHSSLNELEKAETKEILVNVGRGIFLPVHVSEKQLIIEVGKKNLVKKDIPATKETIKDQLKKLAAGKQEMHFHLDNLYKEIESLIKDFEAEQKPKK
jgi:prefoldin alpha subunit